MATYKEGVRTFNTSSIKLSVDSVAYSSGSQTNQIILTPAASTYAATITNASMGQACTITIPDPGGASASFLLSSGTNASGTFTALTATKISTGATPVPLVDPASCTISGAAGASNVCTVSIQLKDGAGTNIARVVPFDVYVSDASTGIGISATAASTGFAVTAGGQRLLGVTATKSFSGVTTAAGAATLTLTDTAKTGYYLVLSVGQGIKVSAQLTAGSYGA